MSIEKGPVATIDRRLIAMALLPAMAVVALGSLAAQDRPLPSPGSFLAQARARLHTDRQLLSQYTYLERRREIRLSKLGKVETGPQELFQVYPGLNPNDTYRRLIEVDGQPRDAAKLEEEDQKHEKKVLEEFARREHESTSEREKRQRREAKAKREEEETLDDLGRVYTFTLVKREMRDGRSAIVVDFTPKTDADPRTDDGKLMKKVKGRAWVSEDDYEIARVEVEILDDIPIGLFLGKLYQGTTAAFERRRVNNEVWLPAEARFNGTGRALVRKFRVDTVVQYSDYKKFSVATDTTFKVPK